jgi:hypothetical protein
MPKHLFSIETDMHLGKNLFIQSRYDQRCHIADNKDNIDYPPGREDLVNPGANEKLAQPFAATACLHHDPPRGAATPRP